MSSNHQPQIALPVHTGSGKVAQVSVTTRPSRSRPSIVWAKLDIDAGAQRGRLMNVELSQN